MKRLGRAWRYLFPLVGAATLVLAVARCGGNNADTSAAGENAPAAGANTPASAAETSGSSSAVDACKLLTKADAAALFGKPASSQEPDMAPLPDQIGVCQWGWVGEEQTQQLSLKVMTNPDDHFAELSGAQPLDLSDRSELIVDETIMSMAVNWVQDGKFFNLNYESNPFQNSKADALKTLARQIAGRLQ